MLRTAASLTAVLAAAAAGTAGGGREESGAEQKPKDRSAKSQATWNYRTAYEWRNMEGYAACGGMRQSPIALEGANAEAASPGFWKLWIPRKPPVPLQLSNTGHSVKLDVESRGITLISSALQSQYVMVQMHWHVPSEHVIEGKRYPMERHMVFAPADYEELQKAGVTSYPLVVIGELYRIGETGDETTGRIANALPGIQDAGDSTYLTFFPTFSFQAEEFFTYPGSLTTPPCSETVSWHVSSRVHTATADQITRVRDVIGRMPSSAAPLGIPATAPEGWQVYAGNARPIQPLNTRCVFQADPTSNCTTPVKLRSFRGAV